MTRLDGNGKRRRFVVQDPLRRPETRHSLINVVTPPGSGRGRRAVGRSHPKQLTASGREKFVIVDASPRYASKRTACPYLLHGPEAERSEIMAMRRLTCLSIGLLATPAIAAGPGFAAGEWSHETKLLEAQVPGYPQWLVRLFAGHGSRKSCNGAAQLQNHPEALLTADDEAVCKLRTFSMTNGRLLFDTFCTNKRFPDGLLVSSRGTYTPTSYAISTTSTGKRNGQPVHILTTGTGTHVSDTCAKP